MRKILAGFLLALVIGIPAVYFGLPKWAERQAVREIDAAFAAMGSTVGKATHGTVSYDFWSRTLEMAGVQIEFKDSPAVLKIGQIVALRASSPAPGRFAAERINLTDTELAGLQWGADGPRATYRAPQITLENYSGPVTVIAPAAGASTNPGLQLLDAITALSASRIAIPTLSASAGVPPADTASAGPVEYGVTSIALRDLANGKAAAATAARITMTGQATDLGTANAEIDNLEVSDIDLAATRAAFDPQKPADNSYRRIYSAASTGSYRLKFERAGTVSIESLRAENLAMRPAAFADPELFNLESRLRKEAVPLAEMRALYDKLAAAYEGLKLGKVEGRGLSTSFAPGSFVKVDALKILDFDSGKLAELAVEGVEARMPANEPVTIGRAALKGIDIAKILRGMAGIQVTPAPDVEQALAFLTMLGGVEVKGASFTNNLGTSRIDNLSLTWDKFVGAIPSQIRAAAQFSAPIDPRATDSTLRYLVDAGIKQISANIDLGLEWNEAAKSLDLAPVVAEIANVYGLSARLSVNNVPRTAFAADPASFVQTVSQLEAGAFQFSIRDLGGQELLFAQIAKDQQMTPDLARQTAVDAIRAYATMNPEAQALAPAIARFIETPKTTLNVVMTPLSRVGLMEAISNLRLDPTGVLARFKIEASTQQ